MEWDEKTLLGAMCMAQLALSKATLDQLQDFGILTNEQVIAVYEAASRSISDGPQNEISALALPMLAVPAKNRSPSH